MSRPAALWRRISIVHRLLRVERDLQQSEIFGRSRETASRMCAASRVIESVAMLPSSRNALMLGLSRTARSFMQATPGRVPRARHACRDHPTCEKRSYGTQREGQRDAPCHGALQRCTQLFHPVARTARPAIHLDTIALKGRSTTGSAPK